MYEILEDLAVLHVILVISAKHTHIDWIATIDYASTVRRVEYTLQEMISRPNVIGLQKTTLTTCVLTNRYLY